MSDRPGHDALWLWFGLSRAGYCTMPRVLMHAMPDEWQGKMATLMEEWDKTWDWQSERDGFDSCRAQTMLDGRLVAAPDWLTNYRHPDRERIEAMRLEAAQ